MPNDQQPFSVPEMNDKVWGEKERMHLSHEDNLLGIELNSEVYLLKENIVQINEENERGWDMNNDNGNGNVRYWSF